MRNQIRETYALESLSGGGTVVHRMHPTMKLLMSLVFLVVVASFDRYSFGRLVPYVFYPTLWMAFSETPYPLLLRRFLVALPFVFFAGVANAAFDRDVAFYIGGVAVSYGVVSLFTILFKAYLCVMAVLVLVAVTPFSDLTGEMRRFRMPAIFVLLLEMTYRYLGTLFDEAHSMYIAYLLRGAGKKGIAIRDMGSFVGQLLIRSMERSQRVYYAMKCRGYDLERRPQGGGRPKRDDVMVGIVVCLLCLAFRFVDANALFARALGGV